MSTSKSTFNLSFNQDNPNVNDLIREAFGNITKDDIRVGYIDPVQGYIFNVTICQANDYAKRNPGTRFIFRDGDNNIRYLNINEVNDLTESDLIPQNECEGLQAPKKCDAPPRVQILGGGGVGAKANAVVGTDGSLLAIDLIEGGYGYQYPPQVKIIDECRIGVGAVARSFLGEIVDTVETYEDIIEEYEICETEDLNFDTVYGLDGEDLGQWDPTIYFDINKNNIALEIERYQEQLIKYKNPFWTTRKFPPSSIVSSDKKDYNVSYSVTHPNWNEFMNSYAISPISPSNVPRTDSAGNLFTIQWEVDFPYDGNYIFRGLCDNNAKLYIDNLPAFDLRGFKDSVTPVSREIKRGIHNIRVDLYNEVVKEIVKIEESSEEIIPSKFIEGWNGPGVYLDLTNYSSDVDVNFRMVEQESNIFHGIIFPNIGTIDESIRGDVKKVTLKGGRIYGPCLPTVRTDLSGLPTRIFAGNEKPSDVRNVTDRPATQIVVEEGRDDWNDFVLSVDNGVFKRIDTQPIVLPPQKGDVGKLKTDNIFNTVDYITKANRTLWRISPNAGAGSGLLNQYGVLPFDPRSSESQTNSYGGTHRIIWNDIKFPVDGNYNIRIAVDDNVTVYIGSTVIRKEGFVRGTSNPIPDLNGDYYFKAGTYTITADLEQIPGNPISKGNPMALAIDIKTTYAVATKKTYKIQEVVSPKSWNENPFGVSLTIDAPEPPPPLFKPPLQEGRCPPNPIWSTRFPGSKEQWYPVRYTKNNAWSKFMNEYALSPTKPLDTPGSDKAGITYKNSWEVELPYAGFYGVKGSVDNTGRLLIDGEEVIKLSGFSETKPPITKKYLTKGKHTIDVEVYNEPQAVSNSIDKKIFSTQDWRIGAIGNVSANTITEGWNGQGVYLDLTNFSGNVNVKFRIASSGSDLYHAIVFPDVDTIGKNLGQFTKTYTLKGGRIYGPCLPTTKVGLGGEQVRIFAGNEKPSDVRNVTDRPANEIVVEEGRDDWNDFVISVDVGIFRRINTPPVVLSEIQKISKTLNEVTYSGPPLFSYSDRRWSNFMNKYSVSPKVFDDPTEYDPRINGKFTLKWDNVDFPEDGEYNIQFLSDNIASLTIGNRKVYDSENFSVEPTIRKVNLNKGVYSIIIELTNVEVTRANTTFDNNPMGVSLYVSKKVDVTDFNKKSWYDNPMAVSAILIPPPCPKKVSGRGVISRIIVTEPGNGYFPPAPVPEPPGIPGITTVGPGLPDVPFDGSSIVPGGPGIGTVGPGGIGPGGAGIGTVGPGVAGETIPIIPPGDVTPPGGYPVILELTDIVITDPGINYDPNKDKLVIIPNNGASISFETGPFGDVTRVNVNTPGIGFTDYPVIYIDTETGINFSAVPVFNVIRDPLTLPGIATDKLIQVTDLVGLKQTGYVNGRPYYGAVYYENGLRYAGYYKTIGTPVRVYDTLQESITGEVVTPPSAIERFGTDINSNNPNLNIPGTPTNLI